MVRRLIKIGNSTGVTLDKKMLKALRMDGITYVWVESSRDKKRIIIRKREENEW